MSGPYPIPARPTTYKGVQMRSRLEARVAAWMDEGNLRWQYEPRVYKSRAREYLPDFQVGDRTFIEVKPYIQELADEITTTTILDWAVLHQGSRYPALATFGQELHVEPSTLPAGLVLTLSAAIECDAYLAPGMTREAPEPEPIRKRGGGHVWTPEQREAQAERMRNRNAGRLTGNVSGEPIRQLETVESVP